MISLLPQGTPYQILGLLHILAAVVAFGPIFSYPALRRAGQTAAIASNHMKVTFPALVVLWVLGMGLAGMSQETYKVSQVWLVLSLFDWIVLVCVSWFLIRPALSDTSPAATSKLMAGTGITHLGLIIGLFLMIFKPFL